MWKYLPVCSKTWSIRSALAVGLYTITRLVDDPMDVKTVSNSTVSCENRSMRVGSEDKISCLQDMNPTIASNMINHFFIIRS